MTYSGKEEFIKKVSEWLSTSSDEKRKMYKNKIIVGYSGGGAVAAYYMTTEPNGFDAAIIMSGPIDGDEEDGYKGVFRRLALSARYVSKPLAFIYGKLDPKTSFTDQAKTFKALLPDEISEKSKFYELPGVGHNVWEDYDSVVRYTLEFLEYLKTLK